MAGNDQVTHIYAERKLKKVELQNIIFNLVVTIQV